MKIVRIRSGMNQAILTIYNVEDGLVARLRILVINGRKANETVVGRTMDDVILMTFVLVNHNLVIHLRIPEVIHTSLYVKVSCIIPVETLPIL